MNDGSDRAAGAAGFVVRGAVGVVRSVAIAVALVAFASVVLVLSPLRVRIRHATPSAWVTSVACRVGVALLGVRVTGEHRERIRHHDGLLFANHVSWLDIIVLLSVAPVRFLSAVENRRLPVIGPVAAAIGTVFVDRGDETSRARARAQVAAAPKRPPLVIFPEGGVPDDHVLWPFRFGAFELAAGGSIPILPVAIVYDRPLDVRWGAESLPISIWRAMADVPTTIVRLDTLPVVETGPGTDAPTLAAEMHRQLAGRLHLPAIM